MKRIGTSSPFRNKDGSLDKRRVNPQTGEPRRKSSQREIQYSDKGFETEEDLEGTAEKQGRRRGRSGQGGPRGEEEFLTKSGKPDQRRVVPRML